MYVPAVADQPTDAVRFQEGDDSLKLVVDGSWRLLLTLDFRTPELTDNVVRSMLPVYQLGLSLA